MIAARQKTVLSVVVCILIWISIVFSFTELVSAETADVFQTDYYVKTYGYEEGLLSLEVNAVCQTQDGQIWAGTYSGLYVFDGLDFSRALQNQEIYSVTALLCGTDGKLWIGSNDRGIFCYDPQTKEVQNWSSADGLGSDSIRALCQDAQGRIFVGTPSSLDVIENGVISESLSSFSDVSYIRTLCCTEGGDIAGSTNAGDLFYYRDGSVTLVQHENLGIDYLNAVCSARGGGVLAADSEHSIYRLQLTDGQISSTLFGTVGDFSSISSFRTAENREGYYICADNGFGFMDEEGNFTDLTTEKFDLFFSDCIEDYQGNIWTVSSKQGIAKYSENMFSDLLCGCSDQQTVANCVLKGHDGNLYIGCDEGVGVLDSETEQSVESEFTELFSDVRVRNIYEDSSENIWVSTYSDLGLVKISPDGNIVYYNEDNGNAPGSRARFVKELADGTILGSFSTGLLFIDGTQDIQMLGQKDGMTTTQILDFTEQEDGTILAGSDGGGIYVIRDRKVVDVIDQDDGLDTLVVLKIVPCKDGYLFVTSNALYYDNGDSIRRLENFPYNNNYDVYITEDAQAWITSSAGIYVVSEEDLLADEEDYNYVLLNERHGFDTTLTSNAWNYIVDDDIFYLCCSSGIYKMSIKEFNQTSVSENIRVKFMCLMADGVEIEPDADGNYIIPKGTKRLTVYPEVLNYNLTNPYVNVYMTGFDDTGVTFSQSNQQAVDFTNIPAGDYSIGISIQSEQDLREIVSIQIPVTKAPQFTETKKFYVLTFVGMFLVILGIVEFSLYFNKIINRSAQVEEMQKAREEADRANNAKTMFLARMSHEIRTPINTILGMNEMIMKETDSKDIKSYTTDIANSGGTLLSLINEILDLTKLDTGRMRLEETVYDTAKLLRECCNAIELRGYEKGLEIVCDIDQNIPVKLYGDEIKIREVILNLISNAVKYTNEGEVKLSVNVLKKEDSDQLVTLKVCVTDTGIGISQEDQNRIFGAFERVVNHENEGVEGTGLGLNICRKMLALMNSEIHVISQPGKGSSFWFEIIQKKMSDDTIGVLELIPQADIPEESGYVNENARILIVDDTFLNLKVSKALLKRTLVQVDTASSGVECTHMVEARRYDLILMDHMMPQMDGIETLNWIRNHPNLCQDTPIIVLTANALVGVRDDYLKMGFCDYLSKPVTGMALEEMLQKYIPVQNVKLDRAAGLSFCDDDEEFYREILKDFSADGSEKKQRMEKDVAEGNWGDFQITAHSLKGSARMIGAEEFSELAKEYEMAAKEGKYDFISQNCNEFYQELDKLIEYIKNYLG